MGPLLISGSWSRPVLSAGYRTRFRRCGRHIEWYSPTGRGRWESFAGWGSPTPPVVGPSGPARWPPAGPPLGATDVHRLSCEPPGISPLGAEGDPVQQCSHSSPRIAATFPQRRFRAPCGCSSRAGKTALRKSTSAVPPAFRSPNGRLGRGPCGPRPRYRRRRQCDGNAKAKCCPMSGPPEAIAAMI